MLHANRLVHRGRSPVNRLIVDQVCATFTLIAGAWLLIFSYALAYPFTINGVDARPRDMALGFILMLLGSMRLRRPLEAWPACLLSAATGVLLCVLPQVLGYGPTGRLNLAGWNELLTGAVVSLLGVIGLFLVVSQQRRVGGLRQVVGSSAIKPLTARRFADTLTVLSGVLLVVSLLFNRSWVGAVTMTAAVVLGLAGYMVRRHRASYENA